VRGGWRKNSTTGLNIVKWGVRENLGLGGGEGKSSRGHSRLPPHGGG